MTNPSRYIQQLEEEQEALETQRCLQNANDGLPPSYTNNPQDSTKNEPKKVIQPQDIKTGGIRLVFLDYIASEFARFVVLCINST